MEELRQELIRLMNQADLYKGVHKAVEEKKVFSRAYVADVKRGKYGFSEKSKAKVKKLISYYKAEIFKVKVKIQALEVVVTNND